MNKLWILLAVSLILSWWIEARDRSLKQEGSNRRERLVTFLLIVILGFFCGLRTWGNDTVTYLTIYDQMPVLSKFWGVDKYDFSGGYGFYLLTSALKTIGFSAQDYLLFFAFATVIPYVLFVRRFSHNLVFGVFLMFTTGFYTFSLAAIKQCMATGLCLVGVGYAVDRKWVHYILAVAAAMLFHPYALVYLLVPLMTFKPWTSRTFLYMGIFIGAGFFLESLLGTILDITDMMGAEYTEESFIGDGVNIFRVAVSFVPLLLAALCGKKLFAQATKTDNLMFNLAMLNALIMFVGLFGTANYFARLANYFLPAQVIVLPWILGKLHPKDKALLNPACVVGYLGYFIYENAIIRPFDINYSHLSIWEYISDLIRG